VIGSPSMAASASIPPTPQPMTPRPLIMVVCESVPTSVSGKAVQPPLGSRCLIALCQILQVHLMDDAGCRRHHLEIVKGVLGPVQKLVALSVTLEFAFCVVAERQVTANRST